MAKGLSAHAERELEPRAAATIQTAAPPSVQAPKASPAGDVNAALLAELREMRKEMADLKARYEREDRPAAQRPPPPRVPPVPVPPVTWHDGRPCLGEPGPGKMLWGVELPGHKSRVADPDRGAALHLEQLPVWAENEGTAWMLFQRYSGIAGSTRTPRFQLLEAPEAVLA